MKLFRACLIRCPNRTYHAPKDGEYYDIGNIRGVDLRKLSRQMRLPVVHMWIDLETCPPLVRRRKNMLAFVFNGGPRPITTSWRTSPVA